MKEIDMFKMPFKSNLFNYNQKVWIIETTGNLACKCVGRFKGRGRYISAWVNWCHGGRQKPDVKTFEISDSFYIKIQSIGWGDEHPAVKKLRKEYNDKL